QHHGHGGGRPCRRLFQPRDRSPQRHPAQPRFTLHPYGASFAGSRPHGLHSAADSASAFAAYITGNVASNLIGRLISAGIADHFGLAWNFYFFAALNLLGAVLVYFTVDKEPSMKPMEQGMSSHFEAWMMHLKNPALRASFAI